MEAIILGTTQIMGILGRFPIGYMHNDEMCTESIHSGYLLLPNLVGCSWTASDGVKDHSSA